MAVFKELGDTFMPSIILHVPGIASSSDYGSCTNTETTLRPFVRVVFGHRRPCAQLFRSCCSSSPGGVSFLKSRWPNAIRQTLSQVEDTIRPYEEERHPGRTEGTTCLKATARARSPVSRVGLYYAEQKHLNRQRKFRCCCSSSSSSSAVNQNSCIYSLLIYLSCNTSWLSLTESAAASHKTRQQLFMCLFILCYYLLYVLVGWIVHSQLKFRLQDQVKSLNELRINTEIAV